MKKYSIGQNLVEFAIIGALILALALAGIYFFGDSIADLFANNNINTLYNGSNRTALDPDD